MAEIAPSDFSAAGLRRISALLADVFPSAHALDPDALAWSYTSNPMGHAIAFGATDAGALVAHLAARPLVVRFEGREERGLLLQHAATHATQRGRGLFGALIEAIAAAGARAGFGFLLSASNAMSAPIFVGRHGFQALGPLDVRVGLGLAPPWSGKAELQLETVWSPDALAWRLRQPGADYRVRRVGDAAQVLARTSRFGPWMELAWLPAHAVPVLPAPDRAPLLCAWIGLDPRRRARPWAALPVPLRLRPSPLELVLRDFSGRRRFDRARSAFCALDFDAY